MLNLTPYLAVGPEWNPSGVYCGWTKDIDRLFAGLKNFSKPDAQRKIVAAVLVVQCHREVTPADITLS